MSSTTFRASVELPMRGLSTPPITSWKSFKRPPNTFRDLPGTTTFTKRHATKSQAEWERSMAEQWKLSSGCSSSPCPIFSAQDSTGNRALCSLHYTEDHPPHLLSSFYIHGEQLQSSLVETPEVSDSSVRRYLTWTGLTQWLLHLSLFIKASWPSHRLLGNNTWILMLIINPSM